MGSKVGALLIDMAMNTAAFASDLAKTQNNLNSWASSSNKTLGQCCQRIPWSQQRDGQFY